MVLLSRVPGWHCVIPARRRQARGDHVSPDVDAVAHVIGESVDSDAWHLVPLPSHPRIVSILDQRQ
jgi:hypothetical protein